MFFRRLRRHLNNRNTTGNRDGNRDTRPRIFPNGAHILIIGMLIPSFLWTFALVLYPPSVFTGNFPNSNVFLLTAHPDDESMFFGPTLHRLSKNNVSVNIICFSTGDNEGIGHVRKAELEAAVSYFGSEKNPVNLLQIVDKPNIFPDSMTVEWNSTLLALHTKDIIESYISPENKDSINILTFDYFGVSGHANHRALFHAAKLLSDESRIAAYSFKPENGGSTTKREEESILPQNVVSTKYHVWTLKSVPIYRKYIFVLDSFISYLSYFASEEALKKKSFTIVSSFEEYSKTLSAMTKAHVSQMKWFRYAWTIFSRYMVVNDINLLDEEYNLGF
ncbi:uncharacterized protein SAPINGB_P001763 [Magnusiomyces paraingens]|uniref:N-acetylglucosaminylphosphatidylinositol deacetylase n=1 Tax=Magnusiomyces paraingens TaxID=2606893 RepID=A0A5E8BBC9_9ASCO|nr:uncharacterized protein SAPINGB_P001763 [Saprochaete ingens]VVT48406.1 unnamed protein product [Saprochaete ingens]